MDANRKKTLQLSISRTMKNLEANNMNAAYAETKEDALKLVKALIPSSAMTASGGSVTLEECGIMRFLREETNYIDRYGRGIDKEEQRRRDGLIFLSDWYLASANAITEHGEIYQVDGRSNRISSLAFGPAKVIIVAGYNKIVPDLRSAVIRVKTIAAPANAMRLCRDTYCAKKGICVSPRHDEADLMCHADCGDDTICRNTLAMKRQQEKGRITVIIVGEELGY